MYVSGTAVKISSSSLCSSSSDLAFEDCSSVVCGGSHEATRRWLRARATLARLRIMSVEDISPFFLFVFLLVISWGDFEVEDVRETFDMGGSMVTA